MTINIENPKLQLVFKYFSQISKIPRGSGNEKAISDYLVSEAKKLGLEVIQDKALNVIIKKPGTKGYENSPGVILQGHMDMVCEKNKDTVHDFTKDEIKLRVEGDYLYATGTTLGADNGIAVAMGLALLACDDTPHPPLEVLYTVNEEVSMIGAMKLDGSIFKGRYIINVDSEEEGKITVSCAGGVTAIITIDKEYKEVSSSKTAYNIGIKGLQGGHSGMEIDKKRGNSNVLMGRVLNHICKNGISYDLVSIHGGLKNNAIPRESECVILIDDNNKEVLQKEIGNILDIFKNELKTSDPGVILECNKGEETYDKALSDDVKNKIIGVLNLMPRGIQTMSPDIEGLVESSTNLGVVVTNDNDIKLEFATRSSVKSLKEDLNYRMELLSKFIGVKLDLEDDYPEWEYAKNSKLEKICEDTYEEITGKKPEIVALHAGLECGLLLDAIKGAEAVSIGPDLFDVHTPNEHLSISSTEKTWDYLVAILKNIK
ncbi:MAG TPA: aminoacyl-histidine dipeptidase [Terrisporobacter glycolicus]|uniref:Cytosol non-specific dipeptidase n=1 Tax=Terrisporobacter petrolearius TaxID=1460447 RepID=A0ABZ3FFU6_9FIRM|nr:MULTISPECIES: aminoacyl-histidine dipeptidase [Terrisporobacter]MBN9646173.1 aminoacyl-histidine dipeptidase [Terrisporobacter glycolicus]HBI92956.1 aminoacyl-histidine dipeptidase [Terrisporobacter hibernicus]